MITESRGFTVTFMTFDAPTLFLIDDSPESREGMEALAQALGLRCESFDSAERFLASHTPPRAGCALVDFRLPGMNGLELQHRLAELDNALPVILISACADVRIAVQAVKGGAYSVLEKPCAADELCETIQRAIEHNRRLQSARQQWLDLKARFDQLDVRQREVLTLVLQGLPNKAIIRQLDISPRTLNRIRAEIMSTMGARTVVELARVVDKLHSRDPASCQAEDIGSPLLRLDTPGHRRPLKGMRTCGQRPDFLPQS